MRNDHGEGEAEVRNIDEVITIFDMCHGITLYQKDSKNW